MYPNLEAELKRRRIRRSDLAKRLGVGISTISEKMQGKSDFSIRMAFEIQQLVGQDIPIETLFAKEPMQV